MNSEVKNKNTGKIQKAILHEDDGGLPLFSIKNTLYFNEMDRDAEADEEEPDLFTMLPASPGMEMDTERRIAAFREEALLPELPKVEQPKADGELSGAGDWGDELLVLLPELQELTDRGNFVTGHTSGDIPELPEILGKLTETSEKLERISSVIEKFEQEYRT